MKWCTTQFRSAFRILSVSTQLNSILILLIRVTFWSPRRDWNFLKNVWLFWFDSLFNIQRWESERELMLSIKEKYNSILSKNEIIETDVKSAERRWRNENTVLCVFEYVCDVVCFIYDSILFYFRGTCLLNVLSKRHLCPLQLTGIEGSTCS